MFRRKLIKPTTEQKQAQAIAYITELDKAEFTKFIDSVKLIWEGYDKLYRVKTKDEKQDAKDDKDLGLIETL